MIHIISDDVFRMQQLYAFILKTARFYILRGIHDLTRGFLYFDRFGGYTIAG